MSTIATGGASRRRHPRHTLAEVAAAELLDRIMSGAIPPGAPLRLTEIAGELEMSPMPVREALRRLAALGIVEIEAHKGARVRDFSIADLEDTQATRLKLESLAVEMAAQRFTDADAIAARSALAKVADSDRDGDPLDTREAHAAFHFALYRASGSHWLVAAIEPVWQNSERYRFSGEHDAERAQHSHREHEAILLACESHDPEAAVAALGDHLQGAWARIRASLDARLARAASRGTS